MLSARYKLLQAGARSILHSTRRAPNLTYLFRHHCTLLISLIFLLRLPVVNDCPGQTARVTSNLHSSSSTMAVSRVPSPPLPEVNTPVAENWCYTQVSQPQTCTFVDWTMTSPQIMCLNEAHYIANSRAIHKEFVARFFSFDCEGWMAWNGCLEALEACLRFHCCSRNQLEMNRVRSWISLLFWNWHNVFHCRKIEVCDIKGKQRMRMLTFIWGRWHGNEYIYKKVLTRVACSHGKFSIEIVEPVHALQAPIRSSLRTKISIKSPSNLCILTSIAI